MKMNKKINAEKGGTMSLKELNEVGRNLFSCVPFDLAKDAALHSEKPFTVFIGQMLIKVQRPPKSPWGYLYSVENAITEFFRQRDQWQRDLPYFSGPYVFGVGHQQTCTVEVRSRYSLDHISVRRTRNDLRLILPHPRKWMRVGLGWLFEPPCPCGKPDCVPAPWRNTICRNGF